MHLAHVFCNHAVLQRREEIRVFGLAHGTVTVTLAGHTATAEADGGFLATLPAMEAGGPYTLTARDADSTETIEDIMIGDVFILSGQSNIELPINETDDKDTVFPSRNDVRYYMPSLPDQDENKNLIPWKMPFTEHWTPLASDQAARWSAIGLFTGLHFADTEGVTVGLIASFRGATPIQSFLSPEANKAFPYDKEKLHWDHKMVAWAQPSLLYHLAEEPIFCYAARAAVWYQGESNTSEFEAAFYKDMLCRLITDWREKNRQPDLPFVIIQLNDYFPQDKLNEDWFPDWRKNWIAVQQAQAEAAEALSHARLVKIADMGSNKVIHPTNKRQVAERVIEALEDLLKGTK